jgi:WD40 repeat protein
VCGLAFSPDDRLLASTALMTPGVQDNVLHLWDTVTGKTVRVCRSNTRDAWAVAFSPDGTRLASAGWNGNLVLWETATGKQLAEMDDHTFFWSTHPAVAFSADGKSVRACGENCPLHVCSAAGANARDIPLPEHHRSRPTFSADGSLLVASGSEGVLRVMEAATGKELLRLRGQAGDLKAAAFSHDGRYLATTGGRKELSLWELATAEQVCTLPDLGEESLAFAPDGRTLAAASWDGKIRLWDVVRRKSRRLARVGWRPSALVFSHDGKKLAAGCQDGLIHLIDTAAGKEPLPSAALPGSLLPLAFLDGGKRLAVYAPGRPWANGLYLAEIDGPREKGSPWTARLGERVEVENRPAALSPNGKLAFLVGAYEAGLWSMERAIPVRRIAVNDPSAAAFAPDGKVLATAERGQVTLWDTATGKVRHRLTGLKSQENGLAFSPDSKQLATVGSGNDFALRLWDVDTGKEERHFDILPGEKDVGRRSLTFSPDGQLVAVGDDSGLIQVWEVATGQFVGGLRGPAFAFAPDGKVIAVGDADGLIRLHDVRKGKEVRRLGGHEGRIKALVWSPDGRLLASGAEDHTVFLWDVGPGK